MTNKEKIILAEMQINNLIALTQDLQYAAFIKSHLLPVKYELQRQVHLLTGSKNYHKMEG